MTLLDGILLGLVQGLTEFLPVSSTGHLILARDILGIGEFSGLAFDAALHMGTLVAVIFYFRRELMSFVWSLIRFVIRKPLTLEEKNFCGAIILGTIPAVVLGLLFENSIETSARNSIVVAVGLLIGSGLMWYAERQATHNMQLTTQQLTPRSGFRIGIFQALALFPGMSRSGSTISGALLNGVSREEATRFAFILSFPILLGAGGASLLSLVANPSSMGSLAPLVGGLVAALVSGLVAIHFLIRYLKTHSLAIFMWYRVALAVLILFWVL